MIKDTRLSFQFFSAGVHGEGNSSGEGSDGPISSHGAGDLVLCSFGGFVGMVRIFEIAKVIVSIAK